MIKAAYAYVHFWCDEPNCSIALGQGTWMMGFSPKNTDLSLYENLTPDVVVEMISEKYPGWLITEDGHTWCPKHNPNNVQ